MFGRFMVEEREFGPSRRDGLSLQLRSLSCCFLSAEYAFYHKKSALTHIRRHQSKKRDGFLPHMSVSLFPGSIVPWGLAYTHVPLHRVCQRSFEARRQCLFHA